MKILVLSDTHGKHKQIKNIDLDTDMVIHCGDATNHYIPHRNYYEWFRFIVITPLLYPTIKSSGLIFYNRCIIFVSFFFLS